MSWATGISFKQFSRPWRGQSPDAASVFTEEKATHFHPEPSVLSVRDKQQADNPGKQVRVQGRNLEVWVICDSSRLAQATVVLAAGLKELSHTSRSWAEGR